MASVLGALDDAHEQRKQKPDPREVAKTMNPLSDGALQEKAAEYQKIAKAQYLLLKEKSLRLWSRGKGHLQKPFLHTMRRPS